VIRRGEIYLVDFPAGWEGEQHGRRPALVIQNDVGNEYSTTTIVAAMTSRATTYDFHVRVKAQDTGLSADSTVMLEQVRTVSQRRLSRKLGQLKVDALQAVDRALHVSLGLID
jgi:mRNA interferase MazF